MYLYKLLYFDKLYNYLGTRTITSPGAGFEPLREYVKENFWQEPTWGLTPAYVIAVPVDHDGDPVMVVSNDG